MWKIEWPMQCCHCEVSTRANWRWSDVPLGSVRRKLEESRKEDNTDVLFVCNTPCLPMQVFSYACLTLKMKAVCPQNVRNFSVTQHRIQKTWIFCRTIVRTATLRLSLSTLCLHISKDPVFYPILSCNRLCVNMFTYKFSLFFLSKLDIHHTITSLI
jgi:hypothetical protein